MGKNIDKKLSKIQGNFRDYLHNKINETFFLAPIHEAEVLRELTKLDISKTAGPDSFTPRLANIVAQFIYRPLTVLYNKAIEEATFPSGLKLAKVIALYKKGSRFLPENYRPISLLNCFSKILERLIYKQMINFINKHKILYIHQYGFRKDFSTTLALIDMVDKIKAALDQKEYVIGIFWILRKHSILYTMKSYYTN